MTRDEQINHYRELLATYRRNLAHAERRASQYGGEVFAPTEVASDFAAARQGIAECQEGLRKLGAAETDEQQAANDAATLFASMPTDSVPDVAPLPTPFRMPRRHNPQFVGRQADFMALARLLKAQQTTAIFAATGLGGVGKTQLASEFAHRYGQFFVGGVFWIDASSATAMRAEIAVCGGEGVMNLPGFSTLPDLDARVERVRTEWQHAVPRLLVFDNLEDPQLLDLAPTSGGCRVLLTARRSTWRNVKTHQLDVLPRPESLRLLLTPRYGDSLSLTLSPSPTGKGKLREQQGEGQDLDHANAICDALGDLPLAVTLAGIYLHDRPSTTLHAYRQQISAAATAHVSLNAELEEQLPTSHAASIVTTFGLSYDQLLNDEHASNALARTLLERAAQCAPAPIPRRLLARRWLHPRRPRRRPLPC